MKEHMVHTATLSERYEITIPAQMQAEFAEYDGFGVLYFSEDRWYFEKPGWFHAVVSTCRHGGATPSCMINHALLKIPRGVLTIPPALRRAPPGAVVLEMTVADPSLNRYSNRLTIIPLTECASNPATDDVRDAWGSITVDGHITPLPSDWLSRIERRAARMKVSVKTSLILMGLFLRLRRYLSRGVAAQTVHSSDGR